MTELSTNSGLISFACYDTHKLKIFAKLNIIKFSDLILLCTCLFIYKQFIIKSTSNFSHVFNLASNTHEQNTKFALHGLSTKPTCNILKYGTNAFAASEFPSNNLRQISYFQLKVLIKNYFFNPCNHNTCLKICVSFVSDYFMNT